MRIDSNTASLDTAIAQVDYYFTVTAVISVEAGLGLVAAILKRSPAGFQALNLPLVAPKMLIPTLGEVGDFRSLPKCSWENLWKPFHTRSWVELGVH